MASPRAGTYQLKVGTFDPATWDELVPAAGELEVLDVILEPLGQQGGILDLNFHFATATGVHAAAAAEEAEEPLFVRVVAIATAAVLLLGMPVTMSVSHGAPGSIAVAIAAIFGADVPS